MDKAHLIPSEDVKEQLKESEGESLINQYSLSAAIIETSIDQNQVSSYIKGVIETLLFINEKPVSLDQIKKALETVSSAEIQSAIKILQEEHAQRESGMVIMEIAEGYQMLSNPKYAVYARRFYTSKHKEKLSKPALETLAILAYKQPVTRADIELIRGVNSDGVMAHLFNKELIKEVGRKEVLGRPFLFGTTKQFLEYFGLKSLEDLPRLEDFPLLNEAKEGVEETESPSEDSSANQPVPSSQGEKVEEKTLSQDIVNRETNIRTETVTAASSENSAAATAEKFHKEADEE